MIYIRIVMWIVQYESIYKLLEWYICVSTFPVFTPFDEGNRDSIIVPCHILLSSPSIHPRLPFAVICRPSRDWMFPSLWENLPSNRCSLSPSTDSPCSSLLVVVAVIFCRLSSGRAAGRRQEEEDRDTFSWPLHLCFRWYSEMMGETSAVCVCLS